MQVSRHSVIERPHHKMAAFAVEDLMFCAKKDQKQYGMMKLPPISLCSFWHPLSGCVESVDRGHDSQ